MRIVFYVLITSVAAIVTWLLAIVIWKLSIRYRLYPQIRARDVHTRPTPRLGGIAMFIGMLVAFGLASFLPNLSLVFTEPEKILAILGAALIIVLIGVADDIWDLDWLTKLAGQVLAAGLVAWQGAQILQLPIGGVTIVSPYTSLVITVLAIVLVMNAINFIDGLDGLVAGVAIIANGVFFLYTYLLAIGPAAQTDYYNLASLITAILIGICLGFLPLNWHPAKLFMGDAGSMLVGLLMATSAVAVTGSIDPLFFQTNGRSLLLPAFIPILLPFAVLIVPLLDFSLAVFRRLRAGKSPFSADRKHLHHRLLDMGHSHFHAVLIFYAWTSVIAVGCLAFMFVPWYWATTGIVIGLVACAALTLAPLSRRKRAERAAQRSSAHDNVEHPEFAIHDPLDAASQGSIDVGSLATGTIDTSKGAAS